VRRGTSRADDPDRRVIELDVNHEQEPLPVRHPHEERPLWFERVVDGERERIAKTVAASSNETPCFFRFEAAFRSSQEKSSA
jgi:hypothetical protein